MRYGIFSAQYLPNMGGVERYTYNLSKHLHMKGHEVYVITSNTRALNWHEKMNEATVFRLSSFNFMNGRFPVPRLNRSFFLFFKEIEKLKLDFIIVNTRFYFLSLLGCWFAHKHNIPVAFIEHGTSHINFGNVFLNKIGELYEHSITSIEKKYCHNFYGVSKSCNEWLLHYKIQAKGVFYNAIDLSDIENNKARIDIRSKYKIPKEAFVVCFTGRLIKEKGILNLIDAINLINQDVKNSLPIYLLIAGTGELDEKITGLVNKNIIWMGQLDHQEVIGLLKESDIFCLPTVYPEGFPTSVLEAAAARCYIITTTYGGSKELIISPDYGCILDDNSPDKICMAINRVLYDNQYKKNAEINAYHRLVQYFTWDSVTENLINQLNSLTAKEKKR